MHQPLLLSGFMATGKSTVGRRIAERSSLPFLDLDAAIEQAAGCSIAELFQKRGEGAFRELEREQLLRCLDDREPGVVVALGGGTLLPRDLRLLALERATVITLTAA